VLAELVALIAPPRCSLCAAPCAARATLCDRCEPALGRLRASTVTVPGLAGVWTAGPYEEIARDLVAALKFSRRLRLAAQAARVIAARAPTDLLRGEIVPVPAAPGRRRSRGFDAAEEIAAELSAVTGLALSPCLKRSEGRRQVGRHRRERLADPPRVRAAGRVPRRALLVDDVITTGATLGACARALTAAGSGSVAAVAFARSE
jgi:ComF family protein